MDRELVFESILDKDVLPQVQSFVKTPLPIGNLPSILDYSFLDLVKMDIDEVRDILVKEISSLDNQDESVRDIQLQKIFTRLLSFQPESNFILFDKVETRFYVDLISTPEIYNNHYVREFLNKKFFIPSCYLVENFKHSLLNKIYSYYDTHNAESIAKFNYILRSSNDVLVELLHRGNIKFEYFFSDRIMSSFDKEDLSNLFRFNFCGGKNYNLLKLFSDKKILYMISVMNNKVKSISGRGDEFLCTVFEVFSGRNNFDKVLKSFYDELVDENFEEKLLFSNVPEVQELINYIIDYTYNIPDFLDQNLMYDMDSFMDVINKNKERFHYYILRDGTLSKILDGSFDKDKDFKKIDDYTKLKYFKIAFLNNVYGIDFLNARVLAVRYGTYISKLEECILEKDRPLLEVLKTIKSIVDLEFDDPNFSKKLKVLQNVYYDFVKEKEHSHKEKISSMIFLEDLFSGMIMNTYNKRLLKEKNCKVLGEDRGVKILDAGVNFDIILTSLCAVANFYNGYDGFYNKWNTAFSSNNQGLCVSHITNQNMGVITYSAPFLGFSDVQSEGLNAMGPYDIYSHVGVYNLKWKNNNLSNLFVPANVMSDETRMGYNELLIDRFLINDSNNDLKIKPSYVVFFQVDDNGDNKVSERYEQSIQIAQNLNIPILVIDVLKVKEQEKKILLEMEEELFRKLNPDLLEPIVTRYINNYTSTLFLTASEYGNYKDDFSIEGMRSFFRKLEAKINSISNNSEREKWLNSLVSIYEKEKKKYEIAESKLLAIRLLETFILDECGLWRIISVLTDNLHASVDVSDLSVDYEKNSINNEESILEDDVFKQFPKITMKDGTIGTFFSKEDYNPNVRVIVDFVNLLENGTKFIVEDNINYKDINGVAVQMDLVKGSELLLVENLVLVYFVEDFSIIPT